FIRAGRLWTMNPDGSDPKVVVADPQVVDYDWSPDSKSLVYARMDGSWGSELYIIPAAGGKAVNITHYATSNTDVTWSATGQKLSFISQRPGVGGIVGVPGTVHVLSLQKPAAPGAAAPGANDIDFEDIHTRVNRPAPIPSDHCSISPDGSKV